MRSLFVFSSLACFSSFALIACGGDTTSQPDAGDDAATDDVVVVVADAGPDVDNGSVSTTYPAFKVDAPQVVTSGGPVLATPNVIPVYFSNDTTTFTDSITTFLGKMAASTYWGPSIKEYGIGALTVGAPVQLVNENAPTTIDDTAIQTWLAGKITDKTLPAPGSNTLFALYYPTGTTITLQGSQSCKGFGGYHNNIKMTNPAQSVAYAVMPRCAKFGGLTGLDAVSATTSHEVIEAATDPYPATIGAYGQVDDNHIIWEFVLGGGETGDMCAQDPNSFFAPTDIGNYVQRTWSNASAKAGHNPCLPAAAGVYFNAMPVLTDSLSLGGGQITTKGVQIAVGASATIEVDLFSDGPTGGPWSVSATDTATLQGQAPELQFAWDRTTGQNGEKLHLTITVLKASQYGAEGFVLTSQLAATQTMWVGTVGN